MQKTGEESVDPPDGQSHAVLLSQALSDCEASQVALLEAHRGQLQQIAAAMLDSSVRPKIGASDIAQEAILKAGNSFSQFRGTTLKEFKAWLRQILVNTLLNSRRAFVGTERRNVSAETPLDSQLRAVVAEQRTREPEREAIRQESVELVQAAMSRLSEDHQRVLELRNREHLTFPQIGELLGRSENAARMLWGRAFDALATELEKVRRD